MRIEKINDHQIRCTLNQKDLSDRELRISELAYGTEKAKSLFRDMMQQASYEFGFEADDIPLMIEAIPMYPDTLVLVITKVDDPDELDTRFSHFTDDEEDFDYDSLDDDNLFTVHDDPGVEFFDSDLYFEDSAPADQPDDFSTGGVTLADSNGEEKTKKGNDFISLSEALGMERRPKTTDYTAAHDLIKIFSFQTLQEVTCLAEYLVYNYHGANTLYKDDKKDLYYLIVHKSEHTPEEFNKICNDNRIKSIVQTPLIHRKPNPGENGGSMRYFYYGKDTQERDELC